MCYLLVVGMYGVLILRGNRQEWKRAMGEVIGGMLVFYLVGKILEWAILRRVIKNYAAMVSASSLGIFTLVCLAWLSQRHQEHIFHPAMLISYFIAALLLPFVRVLWRNRKTKKAAVS